MYVLPEDYADLLHKVIISSAMQISVDGTRLSGKGFAEAELLCLDMVFMSSDSLGEETEETLMGLVYQDIEGYLTGRDEDKIDFLNARLRFYGEEIMEFGRPSYTCMAIYNTLYRRPLEDFSPQLGMNNPPDPFTLMRLYQSIVSALKAIRKTIQSLDL